MDKLPSIYIFNLLRELPNPALKVNKVVLKPDKLNTKLTKLSLQFTKLNLEPSEPGLTICTYLFYFCLQVHPQLFHLRL